MANKNIFIFAFFLGLISLAISLWIGIAMAQHQKPFNGKDMSITGACLIIHLVKSKMKHFALTKDAFSQRTVKVRDTKVIL
jgi:putative Mn2+ efflux pump MntP